MLSSSTVMRRAAASASIRWRDLAGTADGVDVDAREPPPGILHALAELGQLQEELAASACPRPSSPSNTTSAERAIVPCAPPASR